MTGVSGSRRAQTALILAFLIGGTALLIGVSLAFLVASFSATSLSYQTANRALAAATAGAQDGLLQLLRNKDFSGGYTVPLGDYSAVVSVVQSVGQATITSTASASTGVKRRIVVAASADPLTAKVTVLSWRQVPL